VLIGWTIPNILVNSSMIVLGIETSCDETSVAIVNDQRQILVQKILSQEEHEKYGGTVPELAARAHTVHLDGMIRECLDEAGLTLADIDLLAATSGPGMIGGLLVGLTTAKTLAYACNKPYYGINHLEGHALTARLTNNVAYPYLLLLVSGGHCEWVIVEGLGHYIKLGGTIDDALGESFDKVAKMLQLGYPGGPRVEALALKGDASRFTLPQPLVGRHGCDFSFSGLKTAVRRAIELHGPMSPQDKADLCAAFQHTIAMILINRLAYAAEQFHARYPGETGFVLAGGVAANHYLRNALAQALTAYGMELIAPPIKLCTDNAAMIAWVALEYAQSGRPSDSWELVPRPKWPFDEIKCGNM
jgi:N6-L-threonylcarbamoyladenine synthase